MNPLVRAPVNDGCVVAQGLEGGSALVLHFVEQILALESEEKRKNRGRNKLHRIG